MILISKKYHGTINPFILSSQINCLEIIWNHQGASIFKLSMIAKRTYPYFSLFIKELNRYGIVRIVKNNGRAYGVHMEKKGEKLLGLLKDIRGMFDENE